MGTVAYNFEELGILVFKGDNRDEVEEALILGDVDVQSVEASDGVVEVSVAPSYFAAAKDVLKDLGVSDYELAEISMVPNEKITINDPEELEKFKQL